MSNDEIIASTDNGIRVFFTRDEFGQLFTLFCTGSAMRGLLEEMRLTALNDTGAPLLTDAELATPEGQALSSYLLLNAQIQAIVTSVFNRQFVAFTGHLQTEWRRQLEQAVEVARKEGFAAGMAEAKETGWPEAVEKGRFEGMNLYREMSDALRCHKISDLLPALQAMNAVLDQRHTFPASTSKQDETPASSFVAQTDPDNPDAGAGTTH